MEGLFWLLVIVASIITQIVKAGKKIPRGGDRPEQRRPAAPPRPAAPSASNGYTAPQDELRTFLENLTGTTIPEEHPAAPSPRPVRQIAQPVKKKTPARRTTARAMPEKPAPTMPPQELVATIPKARRQRAYTSIGNRDAQKDPDKATERRRRYIAGQLQKPDSVRNAILLSEILMPPVSLRHGCTPAPLSN